RSNRRKEWRAIERDDVVITLRVVAIAPFKVSPLHLRADLDAMAARDVAHRALEGLRREAVVVIGEPRRSMGKTEWDIRAAELEDRDTRNLVGRLCDRVGTLAGRDARFDEHAVGRGVRPRDRAKLRAH